MYAQFFSVYCDESTYVGMSESSILGNFVKLTTNESFYITFINAIRKPHPIHLVMRLVMLSHHHDLAFLIFVLSDEREPASRVVGGQRPR